MYRRRKFRSGFLQRIEESQSRAAGDSQQSGFIGGDRTEIPEVQSQLQTEKENVPAKKQKSNVLPDDEDIFASEAIIPASQEPTQQRFTSQRSGISRTQSSILTINRPPKLYYEMVLMKCGMKFDQEFYYLDVEQDVFLKKLTTSLNQSVDVVKQFLTGLEMGMRNEGTLTKMLSEYLIIGRPSQQGLIKDLLTIDVVRKDLVDVLFNRLKIIVQENIQSVQFVEMIFSQLKFIEGIYDDLLIKRVIELLTESPINRREGIFIHSIDVVGIGNHDNLIRKYIELTPDYKDLLTEPVVNSLRSMCLGMECQSDINRMIINYMKNGAHYTLFPTFVEFLLRFTKEELVNLPLIILDLRYCLKWPSDNKSKKSQSDVFNTLQRSLTGSKPLYDIWLKTIQSATKYRSIDLIIFVIMITINEEKGNYIQSIIHRKIKSEDITLKLLTETIELYPTIVSRYATEWIQIIDQMFRDKNSLISNMGCQAYKLLFGNENLDRKLLLSKLIGFVCEKQKQPIGIQESMVKPSTNALNVLSEINHKYPSEMQSNALQLLKILDRTADMTLAQYRIVLNLLCSVAYPKSGNGPQQLQEHIDMVIQKQVASGNLNIKKQGIVGIIRVIDHIIWNRTDNDINSERDRIDTEEQVYCSISDLPENTAKTAANYIEFLSSSTINCTESMALYFDELALAILAKRKQIGLMDKSFLIWLSDQITEDFQGSFIVETIPIDCGFELERCLCLNSISDMEVDPGSEVANIAVNISGCVLKPNSSLPITVLSSLFHLLRVLHFQRHHGILESIDALLGCAIILPSDMNNSTITLDEYDTDMARKYLDIHYYAVNWLRETIGAYISQIDPGIRKKILIRLSELIKLEAMVKMLLKGAGPDYQPPVCQFYQQATGVLMVFKKPVPEKSKAGKTKKLPAQNQAESEVSGIDLMKTQDNTIGNLTGRVNKVKAPAKPSKFDGDLTYGPKEIYRQLDPDIMLILREELSITYPLPENKIGMVLGLQEFKFVMEDLTIKFESLFGVRRFTCDQQFQYMISPIDFVSDLIEFLPKIMRIVDKLTNGLREVIGRTETGSESDSLYSEQANYLKISFGLCLRLLAALYTWPDFNDDHNHDLLKGSLKSIIGSDRTKDAAGETIHSLSLEAINFFVDFEPIILDLRSAVHLFHLTKHLEKFIDPEVNGTEIVVKLCRKFLGRHWYSLDGAEATGAQCNILIDELLKGCFMSFDLNDLTEILKKLLPEYKRLQTKNRRLEMFPIFNKTNFPLLYRAICSSLINSIADSINRNTNHSMQNLKMWEKGCCILRGLQDIIQGLSVPRNFALFLKHAHLFLKLFLQHGISILETNLRKTPERTNELLKALQHCTRFLHNLCCHAKTIKNTAIVVQIPFVRQTIEQLVFRVKAALAANKCSSVFWMGNLKNRDLHGDEILSQLSAVSDGDEPDDLELPDDDSSDDMDGEPSKLNNTDLNSSRSTCF